MLLHLLPLFAFGSFYADPFLRNVPAWAHDCAGVAIETKAPVSRGRASRWGPRGGGGNRTMAFAPGHVVERNMNVFAHRTLPRWTLACITNETTGKTALGRVADRGPWGCVQDGVKVRVCRHASPQAYAGVADLAWSLVVALDHSGGRALVTIQPISVAPATFRIKAPAS